MVLPTIKLTSWQKKQATLLYHFASIDYLKGVKEQIDNLIGFSTSTLAKAATEDRDAALRSTRWGNRDTSLNWGNNAWGILADFQTALAIDIAKRSIEIFRVTGRYQCARALSEYSMNWTTPEEEAVFNKLFNEALARAANIDDTMERAGPRSTWSDFGLAMKWRENQSHFMRLPKLQVREDITSQSGAAPVRTGVYVSSDDPNATLQFAWRGGDRGRLMECTTLNELGEAALAAVGRADLWFNEQAMLAFVKANHTNYRLRSDSFFEDSQEAALAPSLVGRQAFTTRPCRWYYVEMLHGEFEDTEELKAESVAQQPAKRRFDAGSRCTTAGYYFTPSKTDSRRYFRAGDMFPNEQSAYGATIWQLDDQQEK